MADEKGIGCIFNTHYPGHALKISDKALILRRDGECVFGGVHEVITKERMEAAFGVKVCIQDIQEQESRFKSVVALAVI